MSFRKTMGVTITVGNASYHSITDFNLAIQNTDYLGDPVLDESNIFFVPGRSGPLDLNDVVFGGPTFQYRRIFIIFGGIDDPDDWDARISTYRNLFHGKIVKLTFDNDPTHYWTGRATIEAFDRNRALGSFEFHINYADPYKYLISDDSNGGL